MSHSSARRDAPVVPAKFLLSFILVTSLFSLWGFANDITNPLVAAFKDVFVISNAQSSWVQMAFYGGYGTMAIPAALFIRKFSYRAGIIVGLALYATGALLCVPAAGNASFNLFLIALYILTFGLAFLETTANPYILSMGDPSTATRRLNLAQAFNPVGSLTGMTVASVFILSNLQIEDFRTDFDQQKAAIYNETTEASDLKILPLFEAERKEVTEDPSMKAYLTTFKQTAETLESSTQEVVRRLEAQGTELEKALASRIADDYFQEEALKPGLSSALAHYKAGKIDTFDGKTHAELQQHDLKIVSTPYMIIGFIVIGVMVLFLVNKLPHTSHGEDEREHSKLSEILARLFRNPLYLGGVVAQTFYVGAQIMCWTFIIQYAQNELGMSKATAQNHNIGAMVVFLGSRFICTFFLKYISPGKLLTLLAIGAIAATLGAIHLPGMTGLYCLMGISACMSLMFPTIYGIALHGLGPDAKIASAGLILAIVGGAFMPRLQGGILDLDSFLGTSATRGSFYLPVVCFIVIAIYGFAAARYRPFGAENTGNRVLGHDRNAAGP